TLVLCDSSPRLDFCVRAIRSLGSPPSGRPLSRDQSHEFLLLCAHCCPCIACAGRARRSHQSCHEIGKNCSFAATEYAGCHVILLAFHGHSLAISAFSALDEALNA